MKRHHFSKLKFLNLENNGLKTYDKNSFTNTNIQDLILTNTFGSLHSFNLTDFINNKTVSFNISGNYLQQSQWESLNKSFPSLKMLFLRNTNNE